MRLKHIALAVILVLPVTAKAEPRMQDVISAATLSFSKDGGNDRALLLQGADVADLVIYRRVPDYNASEPAMKPSFIKRQIAYAGSGDVPSLKVNAKGSLVVSSSHEGFGRMKSEQELVIVLRNADFMVAGFTYSVHDSLDPNAGGSCEVNFLSGKALRDGKTAPDRLSSVKLADWSDDKLPAPCQF